MEAIRSALEAAGVEFTNGDAPGLKAAPDQNADVPPDFAPRGEQIYVPTGSRRNTKVRR
jgi:hypothetical protein